MEGAGKDSVKSRRPVLRVRETNRKGHMKKLLMVSVILGCAAAWPAGAQDADGRKGLSEADVLRVARTQPAVLGRVDAVRVGGIGPCGKPPPQRVEVRVAAFPQEPRRTEAPRPPRSEVALGLDPRFGDDTAHDHPRRLAQGAAQQAKRVCRPHPPNHSVPAEAWRRGLASPATRCPDWVA